MGLSSSQARLLNLTRRMHDIEYKAQNLEAQKLQMANESKQVYQEYENALNKQKVQFKTISADGAAKYEDASISTLLQAGYRIKFLCNGTWYDYLGDKDSVTLNEQDFVAFGTNISEVAKPQNAAFKAGDRYPGYRVAEDAPAGTTTVKVYTMYAPASQAEDRELLITLDFTSKETLRNLVEAGFVVFEKPMSDGTLSQVNIATDTNLQEVTDDTELKKAEAKYEADMRKINQKDKKFDTDLAAMDNERNAIKSEMETLKTVAKDNVDRTFKLFS